MIRRPCRIVLTDHEVCRVDVLHALPRQVEERVAAAPAAPFGVVDWAAVEPVLHDVQEAGRVSFHYEGYVWVEGTERADLEVCADVGVVYEGGVCATDVLGWVLIYAVGWLLEVCELGLIEEGLLTLLPLIPFQVARWYCSQPWMEAMYGICGKLRRIHTPELSWSEMA
jgi:hypothetical protein